MISWNFSLTFFLKYKQLFKNKPNETTDTKYEQQEKNPPK